MLWANCQCMQCVSKSRRMGGGFGGKESQGNALGLSHVPLRPRQTGKPCKMRYDRDDDMIITGKRHDFRICYDRCGLMTRRGGSVPSMSCPTDPRCGWALDLSLPCCGPCDATCRQRLPFLPNVRIDSAPPENQHAKCDSLPRLWRTARRAGHGADHGPYRASPLHGSTECSQDQLLRDTMSTRRANHPLRMQVVEDSIIARSHGHARIHVGIRRTAYSSR